jgi:hypothetical protein
MYYGEEDLSVQKAAPYFMLISLASISIFVIDLLMICRFLHATNDFVKFLYDPDL